MLTAGAIAPEWAAVGAPDYILITDEKAAGNDGGTFTAGAWRTRDLNTEQADTGNHAAVAANQITLQAGTYRASIFVPAHNVSSHVARLRNITDGSTILEGSAANSIFTADDLGGDGKADSCMNHSIIKGRFTLGAAKVLEVQHYGQVTRASYGFGVNSNLSGAGAAETYTIVELIREA